MTCLALLSLPLLPSIFLPRQFELGGKTIPGQRASAHGGGGLRWARQQRDARVVAPQQAEVRAVRSLRAGIEQPRASGCWRPSERPSASPPLMMRDSFFKVRASLEIARAGDLSTPADAVGDVLWCMC